MKAIRVHLTSVRLWPLPLWIMRVRVGAGRGRWSLVTPWGNLT